MLSGGIAYSDVAREGGFASTPTGRLETATVLTCPLLFSGIVFSTMLSGRGQVSGILAMNLLGVIFGGLLEYNSMYFGLRRIYTRIKRDPTRLDYQDVALTMHDDDLETLDLFHHTAAAEKFVAAAAR